MACAACYQVNEVAAFTADVVFAGVGLPCGGANEVVVLVDKRTVNAFLVGAFGLVFHSA